MTSEPGAGPTGQFMRRHWAAAAVFIAGVVLAAAWGVYVFWWFAGSAVASGLVPVTLGLWTTGNLIIFMLNMILWETILTGIPVAVGLGLAWVWWRRLPESGTLRNPLFGKGSKRSDGSAGFSLFLFLAFVIKVYLDGNWNVAISTFSLAYVVGSVITIMAWFAAVLAVPAIVVAGWWFSKQR